MSTDTRARIKSLHRRAVDHLHQGIIPFWLERALDREFGGFFTNFDEAGRPYDMPEKYLNTQCRLVWWFSHLTRKFPDVAGYRALADAGASFVRDRFWDAEHGGFFWKIRRDGNRLDDGKVSYGQSFAIYALSEHALATGDAASLDLASRTFNLLQRFAADTLNGGYYENMEPDWSPATAGFHGGDRKGLDTHMHLMEAFTVLYQASGDWLHRRKLIEVTDLIVQRMICPQTGCGLNQFDLAWQSVPAIAVRRTWNAERLGEQPADPTETTSYGHNVELAWLMSRALNVAGVSLEKYKPVLKRLLDHAVTHGIDTQFGGVYRDGLREGGALVLEKEFWQHAECLVGFLDGYEIFGDPRYLEAFESVWNFVDRFLIIKGVGEWRTLCDRQGNVVDGKIGNPWKVSYHTGRALIESAERLDRLDRSL